MLRAKMGMPKASEDLVAAAVEKTFTALTSPPVIPEIEVVEVPSRYVSFEPAKAGGRGRRVAKVEVCSRGKLLTQQRIEKQGRRTVRELFEGESFLPSDMSEPFFPSTKSNYINTRGKGGAVGFIQKEILKMEYDLLVDFKAEPVEVRGELSRKYGVRGEEEQKSLDHTQNRELNIKCSSSTLQGRTHWVNGCAVNLDRLEKAWRDLYWRMYSLAQEEEPLVEPVGLAEFLKVRVITKGPPITYTVLKPLQKFLWKTLKKYKCFNLIGEVVSEEYMRDVLGHLAEDEEFTSGDYQASTDNLHSWLTEAIVDELWLVLSEQFPISQSLKDLVLKALTHHVFVRKDEEGNITQRLPQTEGQLMGSIISFPFLCIANAAMCRYALELDKGKEFNLSHYRRGPIAPLMVNGDDCAIKASRNFRDIWRKVTRVGGLLESQGKTYFSRDFVVINSARFNYKPESDRPYQSQPYINMGLINGCKKTSVGDETWPEKIANIGVRHQELLKWCPEYARVSVHARFMKKWTPILVAHATGIPWYLPTWLGGLGLVDVNKIISKKDRIFGSIVLHEWKKLRPKNLIKTTEWDMHGRVASRLEELNLNLCDSAHALIESDCPNDLRSLEDENSRLYTALVIETLFCCKNLHKDNIKTKKEGDLELDLKLLTAIKHNKRIYQKANDIYHKKIQGDSRYTNYQPLKDDELVGERIIEFLPIYIE